MVIFQTKITLLVVKYKDILYHFKEKKEHYYEIRSINNNFSCNYKPTLVLAP